MAWVPTLNVKMDPPPPQSFFPLNIPITFYSKQDKRQHYFYCKFEQKARKWEIWLCCSRVPLSLCYSKDSVKTTVLARSNLQVIQMKKTKYVVCPCPHKKNLLSCYPPPSCSNLVIFLSLPIMSVLYYIKRQRKREGQRGKEVCFSGEDNIPRPVPFLFLLIEHTHSQTKHKLFVHYSYCGKHKPSPMSLCCGP